MRLAILALILVMFQALAPTLLVAKTPALDEQMKIIHFDKDKVVVKTQNGDQTFNIELAITEEQQARGLMFRDSMKENEGMLFLWQQEIPIAMWMKNTFISLDMLFIDRTGTIVHMVKNTTPNSEAIIDSKLPVAAVLELAGGASERFGIAVGDRVLHAHFKP